MTKKTGGPAYPFQSSEYEALQRGMTLRDWFAGHAIRARWGDVTAMTAEEAASTAYQLADAMLAERENDDD